MSLQMLAQTAPSPVPGSEVVVVGTAVVGDAVVEGAGVAVGGNGVVVAGAGAGVGVSPHSQ